MLRNIPIRTPHNPVRPLETQLNSLPINVRSHLVAIIGELIGTTSFLFFAFAGTQVASIASNLNVGDDLTTSVESSNPAQLLYVALAFGASLTANAWIYFRVSGGLFNPAVTLGMVLIRAITPLRGLFLFITQLLGGIIAAALTQALFRGSLNVGTNLKDGTSLARGTIIEMLLTAQLVFAIFMLAAESHSGRFLAPVGIGVSFFISELSGVFWTGGSLNPARSFGPAVITHDFPTYHWIYWVGPFSGTLVAVLLYKLIKTLDYELVGSDGDLEKSRTRKESIGTWDSAVTAAEPSVV